MEANRKKSEAAARGGRDAGFTLLEIMIVLAIIGLILGVLVVPRIMGQSDKAKIKVANADVKAHSLAYEEWSTDNREKDCPGSLEELYQGGGRKQKINTKDPWGKQYSIICGDSAPDGVSFGVISSGPDKKEGTDDDVKSF